ncbi:MAG: hypothetical protein AAF630_00775 [Cyanobacteria bacterium P01_C01_bin.38]
MKNMLLNEGVVQIAVFIGGITMVKCHKISNVGFSTLISAASPSAISLLIARLRSTIVRESAINRLKKCSSYSSYTCIFNIER